MLSVARLLLELVAVLLAVAVLGWVVWVVAPFSRRPRLRAWGGVVGRERRGWLYRDGDRLDFVRSDRRYAIPLRPGVDQALRRYVRPDSRVAPRVDAYVFRDGARVVHCVGATSRPRRVERLISPDRDRDRVTFRRLTSRWALLPALVAGVCVVWLALWCAASPVSATVAQRLDDSPEAACVVTWTSADGARSRGELGCNDITLTSGQSVPVRVLAAPLQQRVMDDRSALGPWSALVAGAGAVGALGWMLATSWLTMRRPVTRLHPVPDGGSGLRGQDHHLTPGLASWMPLRELALAVQRSEGHADVEDNDLVRTRLAVVVDQLGMATVVSALAAPALVVGLVLLNIPWGVILTLSLVGLALLARRCHRPFARLRAMARTSDGSSTIWPEAVGWRRLDGSVAVCLFAGGRLAWVIPVDRVFAAEAEVLTHGNPAVPGPLGLSANGIGLLAGPAWRATAWHEELVRANLIAAAFGGPLQARFWT